MNEMKKYIRFEESCDDVCGCRYLDFGRLINSSYRHWNKVGTLK
jgi:hypothetical protein